MKRIPLLPVRAILLSTGQAFWRAPGNETSFTGLAATGKPIKENPQAVKRMVRAIVHGVIHTRDNPEDAIQVMMKHLRMDRDASQDAYQLIRDSLNPVPTEKGVELMAQWQAIALNVKPKRQPRRVHGFAIRQRSCCRIGHK